MKLLTFLIYELFLHINNIKNNYYINIIIIKKYFLFYTSSLSQTNIANYYQLINKIVN